MQVVLEGEIQACDRAAAPENIRAEKGAEAWSAPQQHEGCTCVIHVYSCLNRTDIKSYKILIMIIITRGTKKNQKNVKIRSSLLSCRIINSVLKTRCCPNL